MSFAGTRSISRDTILASRALNDIDAAPPEELRALVRELLGAIRETRAVLTKAGFPPDPGRLWLLVEQAEDAVAGQKAYWHEIIYGEGAKIPLYKPFG